MKNEIYKKIIGFEKLIEMFGYWPSFHDAEIINISLDRSGKDEWEGPIIYAKIHVFQIGPEKTKNGKNFIFHYHTIVTFRFATVVNLNLEGLNSQNAIDGLKIEEKYNKQRKINIFGITFEPGFGAQCTFDCDSIEIIRLEKKIPGYSVYKNT